MKFAIAVLDEDIKDLRAMPEVYTIVPAKEKMNLPRMLEDRAHNSGCVQPVKIGENCVAIAQN